jgi:hypothetical protein
MTITSSKKERRAQHLAAERAEQLRIALTTPRRLSARSPTGYRLLQVARVPSFDHTRCFEICAGPSTAIAVDANAEASSPIHELTLRLSVGDKPGSKLVVGHHLVAVPPAMLADFCDRFAAVEITAGCAPPSYMTADGVRISVAITCGQSEATFRWVEDDAPPQWAELDRLAREFLRQCDLLLAGAYPTGREPTWQQALAAMERAWAEGCPVARPSASTAQVAVRRWQSSARRGVEQSDHGARIEDLAKGLIAHQEPESGLVGPLKRDYEYLARVIAEALEPPHASS